MSPRLLVSVRDAAEFCAAIDGGAAVIDIKDPARGSLGAPTLDSIRDIDEMLQRKLHATTSIPREYDISMACGELVDWEAGSLLSHTMRRFSQTHPLTYVKIGMSGTAVTEDWYSRWSGWAMEMSEFATPVGVAYADWQESHTPDPGELLAAVPDLCAGMLLDTQTKNGLSLFDYLRPTELQDWITAVRNSGRWVALAGSLTLAQLPAAMEFMPDYIAVRGGVCEGGRNGRISTEKVAAWTHAMTTHATRRINT